MNIKEMETRTGLPRANIRYYETQGLLAPARLPNGYRDYSEEDVTALRRIALLRDLDVSIEEIRRLQQGEVTLKEVLSRRFTDLEQEKQTAEEAKDLCRRLYEEGVTYDTLAPETYGIHKDKPLAGGPEAAIEDHVVRRVAARLFDMLLYGSLSTAIFLPFRYVTLWGGNLEVMLLSMLLAAVLWFTLETVLLRLWGITPGKWLLGLWVTDKKGQHPDWSTATARTAAVWWRVMAGVLVPFVGIYLVWQMLRRYRDGQSQPWETDSRVVLMRRSNWRVVLYVAAWAAVFLAIKGETAICVHPPHRGELTVAAFAENYNRQAAYFGLEDQTRMLESDGSWADKPIRGASKQDHLPGSFSYEVDENGHLIAICLDETVPLREPNGTEFWLRQEWYTTACMTALLAWDQEPDDTLVKSWYQSRENETVTRSLGDLQVTFRDSMGSGESLIQLEFQTYEIHFRVEKAR